MSGSKETPLLKANLAYRLGEYRKALELYEESIKRMPELRESISLNIRLAKRFLADGSDIKGESNVLRSDIKSQNIDSHGGPDLHVKPEAKKGSKKSSESCSEYDQYRAILAETNLFDPIYYLSNNVDVAQAGLDPIRHYIQSGAIEGRAPSALFDPIYYNSQFANGESPTNPLIHYIKNSWIEERSPSIYFDQKWYVGRNKISTDQALTPFDHYLNQEFPFNYDPSPLFSNSQYLSFNSDVAEARINPLKHYLQSGMSEGRKTFGRPKSRIASAKPIPDGCDALIFVAFCPDGSLSYLQREMIAYYKDEGFFLITVIHTGDFYKFSSDEKETSVSDILIVRENVGFDFGAWAHAVGSIGGLARKCRSLSFTNDSIIPVPQGVSGVMQVIRGFPRGVVFMTRNSEVQPHEQSYFFTVNSDALKKGAICVLEQFSNFNTKDEVIYRGEIFLGKAFEKKGLKVSAVFSDSYEKNPTIHQWKDLVRQGFPFFKIQLITAGIEKLTNPEVQQVLGEDTTKLCKDHLLSRGVAVEPRTSEVFSSPNPAIPDCDLIGPIGQLQAYNLPLAQNPIIQIPFSEDTVSDSKLSEFGRVLAIIHCFYVDIAERMLKQLDVIGLHGSVVCTTDTKEKKRKLEAILSRTDLQSVVVVSPNRGRDVAPLLIEGARFLEGHDYILHLHTKKSPHSDAYADWGNFLFRNLISSSASVRSILKLLESRKAGLIYSKHFHEVEGLRNWGFDYEKARGILSRLNIDISVDRVLEFPTSTMFWARIDAIKPLFDLNLSYDEFDPEEGQVDGTLAHAIERCLLYICEYTGYDHHMVATRRDSDADQMLKLARPEDLESIGVPKPRLLESFGKIPSVYDMHAETYPVQLKKSLNNRVRLNLLIPTMEPEKIYGGISSALKVAKDLYDSLEQDADIRIIVTSDRVSHPALEETARRFALDVFLTEPHSDLNYPSITALPTFTGSPLSIRAGDRFFATAWWTADLGYRLQASQERMFGSAAKIVYLIQDYEPGFYPWSFQHAMAKNTYLKGDKTLAIINSEELANFMTERYSFPECWYIPYEINADIAAARKPRRKENMILVYGRPNVSRNLFATILEGLRLWQAENPIARKETEIVFAGESFDDKMIGELLNANVSGKLSLHEYADKLARAAVGISLMESPHPSYPPLEMASSGCLTITNGYENKDMNRRSENIISLQDLSPGSLQSALNLAFKRVKLGEKRDYSRIRSVDTRVPLVSYAGIAHLLQR